MKKLICITLILLFLLQTPMFGLASAAKRQEIELNFGSYINQEYKTETSETNAATFNPANDFKNILNNNGYEDTGIYWGNRLPPYKISYNQPDMELQFNLCFNFTYQDLQLGAAGYWFKIPVDGSGVYSADINGLTVYNTDTKRVIFDESGIYVYLLNAVFPGLNWFNITLVPESFKDIPIFLSNENYTLNEDSITYLKYHYESVPLGGGGGTEYHLDKSFTEYLPASMAASFIFQRGFDKNGYSSQWINAGDTIYLSDSVYTDENVTYPSIYFPFRSYEAVNFNITYDLVLGSATWSTTLTNPVTHASEYTVNVSLTDQLDYLLTSCPYYVNDSGFLGMGAVMHARVLNIFITPDSPILLLRNSLTSASAGYNGFYDNSTYNTVTDSGADARGPKNIFACLDYQTGQWSRTYYYSGFSWVDLGWAQGYRFPGQTTVYIFMDDGSQVFYNGTAEEIFNLIANEEYSLNDAVKDAVKGSIKWLSDDYLPNLMGRFGSALDQFLNNLIGFIKIIWRVIESFIDWAASMIKLLEIALPILGLEMFASFVYKDTNIEDIEKSIENAITAPERRKTKKIIKQTEKIQKKTVKIENRRRR